MLGLGLTVGTFLVYGVPQAIVTGLSAYLFVREMYVSSTVAYEFPLRAFNDRMKAELQKMEEETAPLSTTLGTAV